MSVRRIAGRSLRMAIVVLLAAGFTAGCHNNTVSNAVTVMVSPSSVTVTLQGTAQFAASVVNATDTTVTWQVNKVTGGTATCGTISANGLYTAPSVLPSSSACGTITITAISNANTNATGTATVALTSGITISVTPTGSLTVGTGETLQFFATVNGTGTSFVNTVNWLVNGTQGGSASGGNGTITSTTPGDGVTPAIYMAPGSVPATATIIIEAQSVADTTQTASVSVTIGAANTPTLTSVSPTLIPQGALFQDLFLTGTNFFSTTTVSFAGQPVSNVTRVSGTVLRARIPSNLLSATGLFTVVAAQQSGTATAGQQVSVVPVRPVALTALPSTFIQQSSSQATNIELDGGYFTPSSLVEFNGQPKGITQSGQTITSISRSSGTVTATLASALTIPGGNGVGMVTVTGVLDSSFDGTFVVLAGSGTASLRWMQTGPNATSSGGTAGVTADPRRISTTIGGIGNDLTTAGLFALGVSTPNAMPSGAAVNVTVRPTAVPFVSNTITSQISVPSALAYDDALGLPLVVNKGNSTLGLLDSGFTTVVKTITVSTSPSASLTGMAVDCDSSMHHFALVVDNGGQDVQAVDLIGQTLVGAPVAIPMGQGPPFAIGVDNVHHLALVVGQNVGAATLLDTSGLFMSPQTAPAIIGTVAVTTGSNPQVTVLPELGWAIVTPGGTGSIAVIDLVRSVTQGTVVFTASLSQNIQGVALDTETKTLLLADPSSSLARLFRLTDQAVGGVNVGVGSVAAAVNPLTRIGAVLNPSLKQANILDLSVPTQLTSVPLAFVQDHSPQQVSLTAAFAAGPNKLLVADDLDSTVAVLDFGPTRSTGGDPQILQVSCQAVPPAVTTGCPTVIVSGAALSPVPLTVVGAGFAANAQIRLDGIGAPTVTTTNPPGNSQILTAMIPVSYLNGGPRRIVVDVLNPTTGAVSNVKNIYVLQAVPVGHAPSGIAVATIGPVTQQQDVALVANTSDNTISVVDVNPSSPTFGTVTATVSVGAAPVSVGILVSAGRAVVANSGDGTAGVIDLTASPPSLVFRVSVGAQPAGVAVDQGLGNALVTSSGSNSVSTFPMNGSTAPQPNSTATGTAPVAAAIASDLEMAAVAAETGDIVQILNVSSGSPVLAGQIPQVVQPVGVDYDPVGKVFLVLERAGNLVLKVDPVTALPTGGIRTGVDPSSLAYDFQSSTLLTLNTASNTLSVLDLLNSRAVDVLPLSGGSQYALAMHPPRGLAVVSDTANNRILLMPMPR